MKLFHLVNIIDFSATSFFLKVNTTTHGFAWLAIWSPSLTEYCLAGTPEKISVHPLGLQIKYNISNSYTMGCPLYVEISTSFSEWTILRTGGQIWYTYISVDLAHHEIFRAKVGKGGKNQINCYCV